MNFAIRKAEKEDAPRLRELLETIAQLHHEGRPDIYASGAKYEIRDIEKKIRNQEERILVAIDENDFVLGYTMSKVSEVKSDGILLPYKKMYIDDVCVDEHYRKHGIGRALMEATKQEAVREGCHIADLNVWAFNENAVRFYESCGMKQQRIYMEYVLD